MGELNAIRNFLPANHWMIKRKDWSAKIGHWINNISLETA